MELPSRHGEFAAGARDGGMVEYSTNGGTTWLDAGPLFTHQGYTGTISSGVVIPPGQYEWWQTGLDFATNPSAPLSLAARLEGGGFYNGTRYGGNATLTVRRGSSFTTSLLVDYNDVQLDQGDFTRSLLGFRAGYYFTPSIFLQSLVQYNNRDAVFSANVRFAWLNTAGTGLFIVLNDTETATGVFDWTAPRVRSFVIKFTRQFGTGS